MSEKNPILTEDTAVDIFGLWKIFLRRKKTFFTAFFIPVMLGIVLMLVSKNYYEVSAYVDLGSHIVGDEKKSIEESKVTLDTIINRLIPVTKDLYLNEGKIDKDLFDSLLINTKVIAGDIESLKMVARVPDGYTGIAVEFMNDVLNSLIERHEVTFQAVVKTIEKKINAEQKDLLDYVKQEADIRLSLNSKPSKRAMRENELEGMLGLYNEQINLLDKLKNELATEIDNVKQNIENLEDGSNNEIDTNDAVSVIKFLKHSEKLEYYRKKLNVIEEKLLIEIPARIFGYKSSIDNTKNEIAKLNIYSFEEIKRLESDLDLNLKKQELVNEKIENLRFTLENVNKTKISLTPGVSVEPVNYKNYVRMAIYALFGLFCGFSAMLMHDVVARRFMQPDK